MAGRVRVQDEPAHYAAEAGRMGMRNGALAFSLGVVAAHWTPTAHPLWPCWLALGLALLVPRRARILAAALVGLGWGTLHAVDAVDARIDRSCSEAAVTGRVVDLPAWSEAVSPETPRARRFVILPRTATCAIDGPVRLTWYDGPEVRGGERWRLFVRLRVPRGSANAHGFDIDRWFVRNRVAATGYVVAGTRIATPKGFGRLLPVVVRERIRDRLGQLGLANHGVVAALTIGDAAAIPRDDVDLYRRTGTMHLLVISGMHVGVVTAFGFLLGRGIGMLSGVSPRSIGAAVALAAAAGYVYLAGAGLPLLRAFTMAASCMVALLAGRRAAPASVFAYALAVVLAMDPMAPLSVGFWLSFGAVAVLLAFFAPRRRPRSWLVSAVVAQLAIAAVFVPSTVGITGLIHPLSIGVNLVAVPAVTLLVVPLALSGVVLIATPVGPWLLTAADFCISVVGQVLAFADQLAPLYVADPGLRLPGLLACAAVCLLPLSRTAVLACASAMAVLLFLPRAGPAPGHVEVTVLDVGQGTAVLVGTARHTLVYDTGPAFLSGGDSGTSVVLPALRGRGLGFVDRLVLSHADLDHVGGATAVLRGARVGDVLAGEPVPGIDAQPCSVGLNWSWDGVDFAVISPWPGHGWSGNNASCVLLIETATTRVLLAGDIESAVERRLVLPPVDVLLVPHHGSATSSTTDFVAATRPRYAVVGAGFENRFGHPNPTVLERYRDVGAHILSTAEAGELVWRSDRPEVIEAVRCRDGLYWRDDGSCHRH